MTLRGIKLTAAFGWMLCLILVSFLAVLKGPNLDSSLMALLPESQQQPAVQRAVDQMSSRFSSRLVLLLSGPDDVEVRKAVKGLAKELEVLKEVSSVHWKVDESLVDKSYSERFPYRFVVIDDELRNMLKAEDYQSAQKKALLRLYSPVSVAIPSVIDDPFGLFTEWQLAQKNTLKIQVNNQLLKVKEKVVPTYFLSVEFSTSPFSPALQKKVLGTIEAAALGYSLSGISVRKSGMLVHAAAGAKQASSEISTIGIGSVVGITCLLILAFRKLRLLLLVFLPVLVGCTAATAVTILAFERIHLITFAFGAGLVGVSIDYALHFICERCQANTAGVLRKVFPGLLLGLFSSALAYGAQSLAPFPGLRQMAVFSVVGLCAAWLTVILWLPLLTVWMSASPLYMKSTLGRIWRRFPRVESSKYLRIGLLGAAGSAAFVLLGGHSSDDIRLLQTSSQKLLAEEQSVQKSLGISSSSQFLVVQGNNFEQVLQTEESILPRIEGLISDKDGVEVQALSSSLPSLKRQRENQDLVLSLYEKQLDSYFNLLSLSKQQLEISDLVLKSKSELFLTPDIWLSFDSSEIWKDLVADVSENEVLTVIRFTGPIDSNLKINLKAIAALDANVTYVDQIENISSLMTDYRVEIMGWVLIAYLLVVLVLTARYHFQVWRIIAAPLLASLFTLALLVEIEGGVNLFHLLALILVLGIGLDMGIFLKETSGADHTWLAVSLSSATSLLAFGLLALSKTPVLYHFGLTVLLGLMFIWLLTPMMRPEKREISIRD